MLALGRLDRASLEIVAPDIARGLRAALVMLVPFYLAAVLGRPALSWTALGGWLGTLADPGGPRQARGWALLSFALGGAILVGFAEPLAGSPWLATSALCVVAFFMSVLRAFGGTAGTIGTFLTIVMAIAGGRAPVAVHDALFFALGAGLALFVSTILWPVWMHLPARRAIAVVYQELAAYMDGAVHAAVLRTPANDVLWTSLVREHHTRIRAAIETARAAALSIRVRRQGETRFGGDVRALLGTAEAEFPWLSALVVELETLGPEARANAVRRLESLSRACHEIQRALFVRDVRARPRATRRLSEPPGPHDTVADALAEGLARACDTALDLAVDLGMPARDSMPRSSLRPTPEGAADPKHTLSAAALWTVIGRSFGVFRDALAFRSPFFHHALRTAAAVAVASILAERLSPTRAYWVTLTTLAILQPYAGATMKRASERVVGTVLGCIVALFVMAAVRSPLALAVIMIPLSVAAVATRPRSYRLFTLFLTPVFVLLAEHHAGDWRIAALRAGDAVLGGAVALLAGVLIVPASERRRLPDALLAAFDAVATYAEAVLVPRKVRSAEPVAMARRAAGIALGEAETSLERFLAEPLRDREQAADAMLLVTYARRLATSLTSFDALAGEQDPDGASSRGTDGNVAPVEAYVARVIAGAKEFAVDMTLRGPVAPPVRLGAESTSPADDALERVIRWSALLAAMRQSERDPSAARSADVPAKAPAASAGHAAEG